MVRTQYSFLTVQQRLNLGTLERCHHCLLVTKEEILQHHLPIINTPNRVAVKSELWAAVVPVPAGPAGAPPMLIPSAWDMVM